MLRQFGQHFIYLHSHGAIGAFGNNFVLQVKLISQ